MVQEEIVAKIANVITHLNSILHSVAFGGNKEKIELSFKNADDYFKSLKYLFSREADVTNTPATPSEKLSVGEEVYVPCPEDDPNVCGSYTSLDGQSLCFVRLERIPIKEGGYTEEQMEQAKDEAYLEGCKKGYSDGSRDITPEY